MRSYQQFCPAARALDLVGERWTLLIVRDACLGLRRFDQFQESLGVARNVLADRLNRLVEEGVLERVRYSERPERYEYRLTQKGRDLNIALSGLRQWGDKYLSEKPPKLLRRKADKKPVVAALVPGAAAEARIPEHGEHVGVSSEQPPTEDGGQHRPHRLEAGVGGIRVRPDRGLLHQLDERDGVGLGHGPIIHRGDDEPQRGSCS